MIDLDQVEAVINRPHVIQFRQDGWTLMHPPACHPRLFACPTNTAGLGMADPGLRGQYSCELAEDGRLRVLDPIEDAPGIDWADLVAELRAARAIVEALSKYDDDDRDASWDRIEIALNRYDDTCDKLTEEHAQ